MSAKNGPIWVMSGARGKILCPLYTKLELAVTAQCIRAVGVHEAGGCQHLVGEPLATVRNIPAPPILCFHVESQSYR